MDCDGRTEKLRLESFYYLFSDNSHSEALIWVMKKASKSMRVLVVVR